RPACGGRPPASSPAARPRSRRRDRRSPNRHAARRRHPHHPAIARSDPGRRRPRPRRDRDDPTPPGGEMTENPDIDEIATVGARILSGVRTAVVGMDEPLTIALGTILAGGHVLFEDVPGLGKTLAARSLAA